MWMWSPLPPLDLLERLCVVISSELQVLMHVVWEKMEMEIRSHEQRDEDGAGVVDMADFNVVEERYVVPVGPTI